MSTPPELSHELVNDIPLLVHFLRDVMGLDKHLDKLWPRHGNWLGLSPGQVLVTWLAHVLSQGDHRMNQVQDWANALPHTLSVLLGQPLRPTDLGDDRLAEIVRHLSLTEIWHPLEQAVSQQLVRVYRLPPRRVRLDTTTVAVYSDRSEVAVLFQRGPSKDHRPDLRQFKLMLAALDPLGVLVAADVVPGHRADDGLYRPIIQRLQASLGERGLLYIGDAKMGALGTRAYVHATHNHYLCPLAHIGALPKLLDGWISAALDGKVPLLPIPSADGQSLLGEGYELTRAQTGAQLDGRPLRWNERVLVVRSNALVQATVRSLHHRLKKASSEVLALTPPGRRPLYADEASLRAAAQAILMQREVVGLLQVAVQADITRRAVRGYHGQPARVDEHTHWSLTVNDLPEAIAARERRLGWRVYATNAPRRGLSLAQAVQAYREEWRIERDCSRLKGRPLSLRPLWVSREDHAVGLTHLLTLAARVLAVVEYHLRQKLQQSRTSLSGLYAGQPTRATNRPTTERLLDAFDHLIFTTLRRGADQECFLTPFSALQQTILRHLDCPPELYSQLVANVPKPAII